MPHAQPRLHPSGRRSHGTCLHVAATLSEVSGERALRCEGESGGKRREAAESRIRPGWRSHGGLTRGPRCGLVGRLLGTGVAETRRLMLAPPPP